MVKQEKEEIYHNLLAESLFLVIVTKSPVNYWQ